MRANRLILFGPVIGIGALLLLVAACSPTVSGPIPGDPQKGKYIFEANGGCGCHGPNLAGYKAGGPAELPGSAPFGELFVGPFGSIPARNITPDKDTGAGRMTDAQLVEAIRSGKNDKGDQLFPIMPYNSFHFMADQDVSDLVSYLRTVPAVSNQVPERQLNGPVPPQPALPPAPARAPESGLPRGDYLVSAISICGDCHTPTSSDGAPDRSKLLAGAVIPREGGRFETANNITPDTDTGIGNWTEQQIVTLLKTGKRPDGTTVGGLMAGQIVGGYSRLTDADALSIAQFIKSIPAVKNLPEPPASPTSPRP